MRLEVLMVEDSPDFLERFLANVAAHLEDRARFTIVGDIATARQIGRRGERAHCRRSTSLPGFRIPSGSSAPLMRAMTSMT